MIIILAELLAKAEEDGTRFYLANHTLKVEGSVPPSLLPILQANQELLLRYFKLRKHALVLSRWIDDDPDHRAEWLPEFEELVERIGKLEQTPCILPHRQGALFKEKPLPVGELLF